MSFESAVLKAKEIVSYIEMFSSGEMDKHFKKLVNEEMYVIRNIDESWVVYSVEDYDTAFSDYFPKRGYIAFSKGSVLKVFSPDWVDGDEYELMHEIPFNDLTKNWDDPEFYFQQSTVYDDYTLDSIVVMWYFYKNNYSTFYLDIENVQKALGTL